VKRKTSIDVSALTKEHQIRRIPIVDAKIVSASWAQAYLALKEKPDRVHKTVAAISKSSRRPSVIAA